MTDQPSNNGRQTGGRFAAGNKAGRGRREGSRNKATIVLEKIMAEDGEAVVNAVIARANEGDMQAARIVLDRILPLRKGRPVDLDLPAVETAHDAVASIDAVVRAMAGGAITPDEAQTVASVIETQRKAVELGDIEQRLAALEEHLKR